MKKILLALLLFPSIARADGLMMIIGQSAQPTTGVANGGTGNTSYTSGSVIFSTVTGATQNLGQNNSKFFWDNVNTRFGLATTSPAVLGHFSGATAASTTIISAGPTTIASGDALEVQGASLLGGSSITANGQINATTFGPIKGNPNISTFTWGTGPNSSATATGGITMANASILAVGAAANAGDYFYVTSPAATDNILEINAPSGQNRFLYFSRANTEKWQLYTDSSDNMHYRTDAAGNLTFETGATGKIRFINGGTQVGIGVLAPAAANTLEVSGQTNINGSTNTAAGLWIAPQFQTTNVNVFPSSMTTTNNTITSAGLITAPQFQTTAVNIYPSSATINGSTFTYASGGSLLALSSITTTGQVGIIKASPAYALDVGGLIKSTAIYVTGGVNFPGILYASGTVQNVTTTQTLGWVCLAGSTIQWTSNGNRAEFNFDGNASNGNLAATMNMAVLLDGSLPSPETSSFIAMLAEEAVVGSRTNMSFRFSIAPTAGLRNACLAAWTSAGTMTIAPNTIGEFSVREF